MVYFKSGKKGKQIIRIDQLPNVLEKIKDQSLCSYNGNNLIYEDFHYNLPSGDVSKFKNAKITSCDVKRSFRKYKNIL